MKKKILSLFAAILMLTAVIFATTSIAFDGNDYGGDGGGNYNFDYDYGNDWDWDYSSSSGGSGDFSLSDMFVVLPAVVIVIIIAMFILKNQNKGGNQPTYRSGQGSQGANVFLPNRNEEIQQLLQ